MPPLPSLLGAVMLSDGAGFVTNSTDLAFNAIPSTLSTGTLIAEDGVTGVTGTNTKFEYELRNGQPLGTLGTIDTIVSDTYLLLQGGASGSTGPTSFATTSYNELEINGDLVPSQANIYNLGNSTNYWRSLHVGPGTITFSALNGEVALLGLDNNGVAYFNTGVSANSLNIGPVNVNPVYGAVGGWNLTATGAAGSPSYDLIAQQVSSTVGGALDGPIYSLLHAPTGPTGQEGSKLTSTVVHSQTYTVQPSDAVILFHYTGSGGVITLPSVSTSLNRTLYIKNLNTTNSGTHINAASGEFIDGVSNFTMATYQSGGFGFNMRAQVSLLCGSDGNGGRSWWVLSAS
jgi:hypothetical protein